MSFRSPLLLLLLLVPVAAGFTYAVLQRRAGRHAVVFPNLAVLAGVAAAEPRWRRHVPAALLGLALVALAVGVARPASSSLHAARGATVILLVDVSGSMRATDVKPSRIEAAQAAMRTFVANAPKGLRIGVVAFSSFSTIVTSPTSSRALVLEGISSLEPGSRTAIGDALSTAVDLARSSTDDADAAPRPTTGARLPPAAIILLSDGAQTDGGLTPLGGADLAQGAAVTVNTVALGTPGGTYDASTLGPKAMLGGPGGSGGLVAVPPDPETLARIAAITGGQPYTAETQNRLSAVYAQLARSVQHSRTHDEVTFIPLAIAIVLLCAGLLLAIRRAPRLP